MKKGIIVVLLCLLLAGCGTTASMPGTPLEGFTPQADLTVYPLEAAVRELLVQEDDLLLVDETGYTRCRDGVLLSREAGDFQNLRSYTGGYYRLEPEQLVLLDNRFSLLKTISFPDGMEGPPLLREDGKELYYCRNQAVWALDISTNEARMLRKLTGGSVALIACANDLLECRIDGDNQRYLLMSTKSGVILSNSADPFPLGFSSQRFGQANCLLVNQQILPLPQGFHLIGFPEKQNQAVLSNGTELRLYALDSGNCLGQTSLEGIGAPTQVVRTPEGILWLLVQDSALIRWDTSQSHTAAPPLSPSPYYSPEEPDIEGLKLCRERAKDLGSKYGFEFKIWTDAVKDQPWDYLFTPEHQVPILQEAISAIEGCLARFPQDMLRELAADAEHSCICLVRQIQGKAQAPALEIASGLQFRSGSSSYLVLCPGPDLEQAVYHELCHLIDAHITGQSTGFDSWEQLNPPDFQYSQRYEHTEINSSYLESGKNYFIDRYSMTFPQEDRARILEYSMMENAQDRFQSEAMQRKLGTISLEIRKAFHLTASNERLPWEQYLREPLIF